MQNKIKAKPTKYKNILFRSRLEAKWAVFFDQLNIKWAYEPDYDDVEFGGCLILYKPDFYLPDYDLWVEVKAVSIRHLSDGEIRKIVGWAKTHLEILVLSGAPRIPKETTAAHYLYSYNTKKGRVYGPVAHIWWCECPKCGKIDIRPYGGIPVDCDSTCYFEPSIDLFGDELPEPEGQNSARLKKACALANKYEF